MFANALHRLAVMSEVPQSLDSPHGINYILLPAVLSGNQRRKPEAKGEEKGTRFGWMNWAGFVGGTIDASARAKVPFQMAHRNYASV